MTTDRRWAVVTSSLCGDVTSPSNETLSERCEMAGGCYTETTHPRWFSSSWKPVLCIFLPIMYIIVQKIFTVRVQNGRLKSSAHVDVKVKVKEASSSLCTHTATGACMPYVITQSYLSPGRGSISRPYRSKALRGPGSTVTWGPSIPSAGPQGLKLDARIAESGAEVGLWGARACYQSVFQFFRSGVFISCVQIFGPGLGGPRGPRNSEFIEPPEPAVSTPLYECVMMFCVQCFGGGTQRRVVRCLDELSGTASKNCSITERPPEYRPCAKGTGNGEGVSPSPAD